MKLQNTPGSFGLLAGLLVLLLAAVANSGCAHVPAPKTFDASADAVEESDGASSVFLRQEAMIDFMREQYPTVDVDVAWMPCGQQNGFYWTKPVSKIRLCTEFASDPGAAMFVAAHEFAHAVTDHLTDTTDENDADEIAALSMIEAGYTLELGQAALWWARHKVQNHHDGAEHPGAGFRAYTLACLAVGSEFSGDYPDCEALYVGLRVQWWTRLHLWLAE